MRIEGSVSLIASSRALNSSFILSSEKWTNEQCSPAMLNVFDGAKNVAHLAPISSLAFPIGICVAPGCTRSEWISSDITRASCLAASSRTNESSSWVKTMPEGFCGEQNRMHLKQKHLKFKLN